MMLTFLAVLTAVLVVFVSAYAYYFWYHQDADLTLLFYEKFGREPCSSLGGKVVWITGASGGIGENLAYELAKCGCKLVLSARRQHELERVRDVCAGIAIKKYSNYDKEKDILVLPLDLTNYSSHTELTSHVIQHFGQIDIFVNCGGVGQFFSVEEGPFEVEKKVLDINLLGTISLTKAVLPHMLERKQGQIAVISSVYGKYGCPKWAAYSASSFGLLGYFNTLRLETASRNIKVLTILPGPVATGGYGNILTNKINVTLKDTPSFKTDSEKDFGDCTYMSPQRHGYLMTVAMANHLNEVWTSTQPMLTQVYMAHYIPSLFMRYQEKKMAL